MCATQWEIPTKDNFLLDIYIHVYQYGSTAVYSLPLAIRELSLAQREPTGSFCCLLRRFSRARQTTNLWFDAEPAQLLRRTQNFAAGC